MTKLGHFLLAAACSTVAGCSMIQSHVALGTSPQPAPAPAPAAPAAPGPTTSPAPVTENPAVAAQQADRAKAQRELATLPAMLSDLIASAYSDEPSAQWRSAAPFVRSDQAFGAAWQAFEARRAAVEPAVATARDLAKSDRAAAIRQLLALISDVPVTGDGTRVNRQWVEPADAEYPACVAAAQLALAEKDFRAYALAARGLFVRRHIDDDREHERMMWFAFRNGRALSTLGGQMEPARKHEVMEIASEMAKRQRAAIGAAQTLWFEAVRHGLKNCVDHVHPGDWCAGDFVNLTVDGSTASYRLDMAYQEPYDCRTTDRIAGIDPVSGEVRYQEECRYRPRRIHERLDASLVEAPPPWLAQQETAVSTWILGKVDRVSPSVHLASAVLPDLRFVRDLVNASWSPSEWEDLNESGELAVRHPGDNG